MIAPIAAWTANNKLSISPLGGSQNELNQGSYPVRSEEHTSEL